MIPDFFIEVAPSTRNGGWVLGAMPTALRGHVWERRVGFTCTRKAVGMAPDVLARAEPASITSYRWEFCIYWVK